MSFDKEIEQEIIEKGLTAPRITLERVESKIASEHYFTAFDGRTGALINNSYVGKEKPEQNDFDLVSLHTLTFCVLILKNGFIITGESACASPENFDAELGRKIAHGNAVQKIWSLEGYLLKQKLHEGEK
jgi:hypothetical protein